MAIPLHAEVPCKVLAGPSVGWHVPILRDDPGGDFVPPGQPEPPEDGRDMLAHNQPWKAEPIGDRLIREPVRDERGDLAFTPVQRGDGHIVRRTIS